MAGKAEKEAAWLFVDRMLSITQRLMLFKDDEFQTAASGVIGKIGERYFMLSAGHALGKPGVWVAETNVQCWPPKMLVLAIPDPVAFDTAKEDFGWAEIDMARIEAHFRKDRSMGDATLIIPHYLGPLDAPPDPKLPFGFAAYKAVEYHEPVRKLWREPRYEINMQYVGRDEKNGLYKFALSRRHQGHDYYRGCSGAPIADAAGRIVSLVIEGSEDEKEDVIWGTPLLDYVGTIGQKKMPEPPPAAAGAAG
jgi:hypothetical protein